MKPFELGITIKLQNGERYALVYKDKTGEYVVVCDGEADMLAHVEKVEKAKGIRPVAVWEIATTEYHID